MSCCKLELVAAFSTLVQSMIQIAVALLVILIHACQLNHLQPSGDSLVVLLYTTYFYNSECGGTRVPVSWTGTSATAAIMLSGTPFTADRTYNFMLVYVILGIAMLITSLLLIAGAANGVRGVACYTFRAPWVVTCALTLLVDAVALVFYMVDVPKSMSLADVLAYISATSTGIQTNLVTNTWIPAVLMAAYFSRLIVIWLLNAVLMIAVIYRGHLQYYKGREQYQPQVVKSSREDDNYMASMDIPLAVNGHPKDSPAPSHQQNFPTVVKHQHTPAPAHEQSSTNRQSGDIPVPPAMPEVRSTSELNRVSSSAIDKQQAREEPDTTSRISNNSSNSGPTNQKAKSRTEWRGQMPWSYLNEVVAQPHRMRDQLPEDEELPPVPVPDYTLHHPKKYRPKVSRDSSDASSGFQPVSNNWGAKEVLY